MKRKTELFRDIDAGGELAEEEASLLFLTPLIQTAWVCGAVSPREKQLIFEAAREDGIDERHRFNVVIDEWLSYQPSLQYFDHCLDLINISLDNRTVKERTALKRKMLDRCHKVASSAGDRSLMDVDHGISQVERHFLGRLTEILA